MLDSRKILILNLEYYLYVCTRLHLYFKMVMHLVVVKFIYLISNIIISLGSTNAFLKCNVHKALYQVYTINLVFKLLPAELPLRLWHFSILTWRGLTVIKRTVDPDWDPCIALRLGWLLRFPPVGNSDAHFSCGVCVRANLITRKLECLYTSCNFFILQQLPS